MSALKVVAPPILLIVVGVAWKLLTERSHFIHDDTVTGDGRGGKEASMQQPASFIFWVRTSCTDPTVTPMQNAGVGPVVHASDVT